MVKEKLYFASREGSMSDSVRPGTPTIGKAVKYSDRFWTVYKWVDKKMRISEVVRQGYTYKGALKKAEQLNAGLDIED